MDYQSAMKKLRTARNMDDGKPIANNTRLMLRGVNVAVRLHNTDVVTFAPDGAVTLNTGGWKTVTTKARINDYSPYGVWSRKGCWIAHVRGKEYIFADGMTISAEGEVSGAAPADSEKKEQAARKGAKQYAKGFIDALYAGRIHLPGDGDCLICRLGTKEAAHVRSHMEEKYYVPSLLVNALKAVGASQAATQTAWAYMDYHPDIKTLGGALAYETARPPHAYTHHRSDFIGTQIEKSLRRHVLHQLGMAA